MRIAVASDGKSVSAHFAHCLGFTIYGVNEVKGLKKEFVKNPGHVPGYLPLFLKELNVNLIVTGAMGKTAHQLFNENSIEIVVGAEGLCDDVVHQYINGELKTYNVSY